MICQEFPVNPERGEGKGIKILCVGTSFRPKTILRPGGVFCGEVLQRQRCGSLAGLLEDCQESGTWALCRLDTSWAAHQGWALDETQSWLAVGKWCV